MLLLLARSLARVHQSRFGVLLLALSILLLAPAAAAQPCQTWSPVGTWPGVNGTVNSITRWTENRLIVAGLFSTAGGSVSTKNICVYRPGAIWTPLDGGTNGPINAVLALPNGDLIVGGSFTLAGSAAVQNIARFDAADGHWAPLASGTSGAVNTLLLLASGDFIAGGAFATAGGVTVNGIGRYSPSAGTWAALGSGVGGPAPVVNALALLPDGQIVAGGAFTTAGGSPIKYIASFSDPAGSWSPLGNGLSATVYALVTHPDGHLYAGGTFLTSGTLSLKRIGRYDPAAHTWASLGPELSGSTPVSVRALGLLPNGRVAVAGSFYGAGTIPAYCLALYDPTTSTWSASTQTIEDPPSPVATAVRPMPDGSVVFGGTFTFPITHVGRLTPNFNLSELGDGVHYDPAHTLCPLPDGRLVVGGQFDSISDLPLNNLAIFDPKASEWRSLGQGFDGVVRSVIRLADDTLIAGGDFTHSGSTQVNGVAWYNWDADQWLPLGDGVTEKPQFWQSTIGVYDMCELPDRRLVVCGVFAKAGGLPVLGVAIYDFNTEQWIAPPSVGGAFWYPVTGVCTLHDGSFAVCSFGGNLKRLDSQFQTWSSLGTLEAALNPSLFDLAVLKDGDLLVGGVFTSISGTAVTGLARLNLATGQWSSVGGNFTRVTAMKCLSDDDVLVCDDNAQNVFRGHLATNAWQPLPGTVSLYNPKACDELFIDGERSFVVGGSTVGPGYRAIGLFHDAGPVVRSHSGPGTQCRLAPAQFAVDAINPASLQFRWQIESDPAQFTDIQDGPLSNVGLVSGSGTAAMTITDLRPGASTRFRCVVSNSCATTPTDPDTLTLCLSDVNCDGISDLSDFFDFFNAWDITDPHADIDGDGQVDLIDFFAFFNAFDAQC